MNDLLSQAFTSQRSTMSLLFKKYSFVEVIYLLIRFNKTKWCIKIFFWGDQFQQGVQRRCDAPLWVQSKALVRTRLLEAPRSFFNLWWPCIFTNYLSLCILLKMYWTKKLFWALSLGAQTGILASKSLWLHLCKSFLWNK